MEVGFYIKMDLVNTNTLNQTKCTDMKYFQKNGNVCYNRKIFVLL